MKPFYRVERNYWGISCKETRRERYWQVTMATVSWKEEREKKREERTGEGWEREETKGKFWSVWK